MTDKKKWNSDSLLKEYIKIQNIELNQYKIQKTIINIDNYSPCKLGAFVVIKGFNKIIKNISECTPDEINGRDIICFEIENINIFSGIYGMSSLGKIYFTIELLKLEFKKRNLRPKSVKGYILCKKRTEDLDRVISNLNLEIEIFHENEEIKRVNDREYNYIFNEKYKSESSEEYTMIDKFLKKNYQTNFYKNKEMILAEFKIANRDIDGLINLDPSNKFIYPDKPKIVDVSNRDLLLIQAKSNKELKKHGLMGVMGQTFFAIHLMNMYYQNIKSVRGIALVGEIPKDQIGIYETFKEYGDKGELNIKIVK